MIIHRNVPEVWSARKHFEMSIYDSFLKAVSYIEIKYHHCCLFGQHLRVRPILVQILVLYDQNKSKLGSFFVK